MNITCIDQNSDSNQNNFENMIKYHAPIRKTQAASMQSSVNRMAPSAVISQQPTEANYNIYEEKITFPKTKEYENSDNQLLTNKLYQSNKVLQEFILKYDILSKTNQELNEKNSELEVECTQLRFQNQSFKEELSRCKKKMKIMIEKNQN